MAPKVSVVIPTCGRPGSLSRLLDSLGRQSLPRASYEVIVVDDGTRLELDQLPHSPFPVHILHQTHQGATRARNSGALQSRGEVLVFIDDDITVSERTLEALSDACGREARVIALGCMRFSNAYPGAPFTRVAIAIEAEDLARTGTCAGDVGFARCNTQVLGIRREDFFALGMFQDPTGGWPNWDDVDFGYRASLAGFKLLVVPDAAGEHWDHSLASLESATRRWFQASKSAVRLFQKYPLLQQSISMFSDMTPVDWRRDSLGLVVRKALRRIASAGLLLSFQEWVFHRLQRCSRSQMILRRLYRWIAGGYKYRGYREGLEEYKA